MSATGESPGPFKWLTGKLKSAAVEKAIKKFSIPEDAVRNARSFKNLYGEAAPGDFPTELLILGSSMWSGFALTTFAQQQMLGWILPYWLRMQSEPSSPSFVPHGHAWAKANLTHRNWTGVGLCGFPNEGTVDPRGLITPWFFSPSVDLWVLSGGKLTCPSELESVEQRLVDDLPIVQTRFEASGLTCTWTTFVAPLDGMPVVLSLAELENPGGKAKEASLAISARPYNNECIEAINSLVYGRSERCFKTDGNLLAYFPEEPDEVMLSDYTHGDVSTLLVDKARDTLPAGTHEVDEPFGLATGAAIYKMKVPAGGKTSVSFACPLMAGVRMRFGRLLPPGDSESIVRKHLEDARKNWKETVYEGMRVKVPEDRYQKAFDLDKAFLLLLFDGQVITPGVSTYHMMWFRDAAYLVPALERMGHADKARRILLTYPDRQQEDGRFRSQGGEWDSNGQAMWTLVNHWRMTGDDDFLKDIYLSLIKGARWIDMMRQKDLPADDPRRGLLPPGISAEHFGMNDTYYWDDLWSVGGLRAAADAARHLGSSGDAGYMDVVADELMRDLEASWEKVRARLGRALMPIAPFRDVDAGAIGALAAVYPLDIIPPEEEIMANTVGEIVKRCFWRDTHYHGIMHCGINPDMSIPVAMYYLRRRDPYALTIFESLWSMATDTYTFPEAINPLTGGGAYGDGHDGWSAGDIFNFVRNLFVLEEGDKLALLPLGKKEWFRDGDRIEVEGAVTLFGDISYSVASDKEKVVFSLAADFRDPPEAIELNVPYPVVSCEVDGKKAKAPSDGGAALISPKAKKIVLGIKRG
ncbi:MAG: hypothetical protein MUP40_00100 [Actinobacteria bacterium]|nr:hypothetical protein [Actinomycetota bacterium]